MLFGAWLKAGIPIVRPLIKGRAPFRQPAASSVESPCDRINSAPVLSRPSPSNGMKPQVVEKMHGSDGGMSGTAIEGVGKGKEKIAEIMGADSRAFISASQEDRNLNMIDKISGVTTNKPVFEFSSQRSKGLVAPSFPAIGPRALAKVGGPDPTTTLAGSGSSNNSQASGRWKRVGHKSKVDSKSSDGRNRLGKREYPTAERYLASTKKLKGAVPKSSDGLVEVEVCGNYNLVQEEWQSRLSLAVAVSDCAGIGEWDW
ncbi:hypothetical protein LWI29_036731 [Acer saccharum]|uniref:Uncharacterized protein n=1 Tax=Acer saccharum TaxID=4024 RepID=A0AA39TY99_ACESA|nr:hypothetical protein LWI29_036731 [Acer saccharum]